jgi:hypothetical protein
MNQQLNLVSETVKGEFTTLNGERYYKIENVDNMAPFFISVVSASNHWLFISSTGALSAGRIRPENALFPYRSVDHIHENADNTGSKTIIKVNSESEVLSWEPFNSHHNGRYDIQRNLYKNAIGDKIVFEEINHTLQLTFEYSWNTSEQFGFVREAQIKNLSCDIKDIELIDGIQNILPPGAPLTALQTRSALVDAYKWNELIDDTSVALYSMYATLSDKADPAESLRATSVFSLGINVEHILLSSQQIDAFRRGLNVSSEPLTRGVRGAYLIHKTATIKGTASLRWLMVADIDQSHCDVEAIKQFVLESADPIHDIERSIAHSHNELISLMSGADAWQLTSEEATSVHHYANVLFNSMRGGVFSHHYHLDKTDVYQTMFNANREVVCRNQVWFDSLPKTLTHRELLLKASAQSDAQLIRLSYEYLPLTFGRRHGDPSRPWNHYEINVRDEKGEHRLSYQGNWRDIFQNWEALAISYPGFIKSFIAKFVNASTMDGYNPYRITKDGVDWELVEPDDPWANIGYWGDHQIIYLLKFLELAKKYSETELVESLTQDIYSYANVPYELCNVDDLFHNPKETVSFNQIKQEKIESKIANIGSDGRLVLDSGEVYLVNLMEKMLVPLLAKLSNLVIDGGIWLNTQRPEWNDANNAIVGNGLSMVTLYYMRRYVSFIQELLTKTPESITISKEVLEWMLSVTAILNEANQDIRQQTVTRQTRRAVLTRLEKSADHYRQQVYRLAGFSGKTEVETVEIKKLIGVTLSVLDETIASNKRRDGLYNSYNIIKYSAESVEVEELYPMLEGQVAILSAGVLQPAEAVELLDKLFASDMYRSDQQSFMLYPDRNLARFMEKNCLDLNNISENKFLLAMIENHDSRIISRDLKGKYHFNPAFENRHFLHAELKQVRQEYSAVSDEACNHILDLYEEVFNHKAFTGRSGTMFSYEGLGCIYWHMVSKLLLAVQECYFAAYENDPNGMDTQKLAEYYYLVRKGIGFNKTPKEYGAFPTDPYSHTPKHAGAQQPGMTGQVKEEIITRFSELGLKVVDGTINVQPTLLKRQEFLVTQMPFDFEDIKGTKKTIVIPSDALAFTYCQVPFIYRITDKQETSIIVYQCGKETTLVGHAISLNISASIFERDATVDKVVVNIPASVLI